MKMINANRGRFATAITLVGIIAITLAACGGGGGGSTPPTTVTQTVTCPNGTIKTGTGTTESAAITAATAQCLGPVLVTVTPSNGATGIAPDTFASVAVATDSTLDQSSLTTTTVTLKAGTTAVSGTVSADGAKGFKFVPSAKLMYAQVYNFLANVKDSLGKNLSVSGSFTTASVSCTLPLVPDSTGTSCEVPPATAWWSQRQVTPVGTQSNVVKQIGPASLAIGDTAWQQAVINQTIQTGGSLVLTGFSTRPATWTVYQYGIIFCTVPVYADDGGAIGAYTNPGAVCNSEAFDWWKVVGDGGIIRHFPARSQCYKFLWNNTKITFDDNVVSCQ